MSSKIFGSLLCVVGSMLMIGGASIFPVTAPSNAIAMVAIPVLADCNGGCDRCGTAEPQADGSFKCIRTNPGGTFSAGNCRTDRGSCQLCTGGCSHATVQGDEVCGCDQVGPIAP